MKKPFVLTIGRQLGSGGHETGKNIADALGFPFYDKELIMLASQKSGMGKSIFEAMDEKKSHSLLGGFLGLRSASVEYYGSENYLSHESLFQIQSSVIRELAENKPGVFVGRCADYVLKNHPRCLNVFISADLEDRIRRISGMHNLSLKEAERIIEKTDKQRAAYYHYFSDKKWGAAVSYHLCINSSIGGIEKTTTMILDFCRNVFLHPEKEDTAEE